MKKFMMTLAAVFCCAMTTAVFTSCGDDDSGSSPAKRTLIGYQVSYSLEFPIEKELSAGLNGSLFRLCTKVEVGYPDENGKEQRETINDWKWSKTITYKNLDDGHFKLYLTYPESIDEASLTYDYYSNIVTMSPYIDKFLWHGIQAVFSDGTKEDLGDNGSFNLYFHSGSDIQVKKAKIQEYIKEYPTDEEPLVDLTFHI